MGLPPFGVFAGFMGLLLTSSLTPSVGLFVTLVAWLTASWYIMQMVQQLLFGVRRPDLRYTDLLRTETALLETRTRYLAAVHDQRIAAAMLEFAAGTLSPDSKVLN